MPDFYKNAIIRFLRIEGETRPVEELELQLNFVETKTDPDLRTRTIQVFNGPLGEFWVTSRGNVVAYWAPERPPASEPLSAEEAEKVAREFILRHQPDFASRNFVTIDTGMEDNRWEGMWQEKPLQPKEYSVFPNIVDVSIDLLTHSVRRYGCSDLRFIRKTPPKISEAEARKIVSEQFKDGWIDEIYLMEKPVEGGKRAITVWRVSVSIPVDPEEHIDKLEKLLINADTGELVPPYPEE